MIRQVLSSARWLLLEPRLILLSAATSIGCDLLLRALGFDWQRLNSMTSGQLTFGLLLLLARAWFALTIASTAVAVLRNRRAAPFIAGVSIFQAFGMMFVTMLPLVPLFIGAALMIIPNLLLTIVGSVLFVVGMVLMASYSVAGMILLDGRGTPLEALESSAFLTRGYRGEILGLILLIAVTGMAAMWLDIRLKTALSDVSLGPPIAGVLHVVMRVMLDLFGTCCIAALYYELDKIGTEVETGPRIPKYRGY